ncbi:hypothetical protein SADUNF_Sadunf09G0035100 [Salix dunnii]|uniref:Uncharacterized protein n=1 Tax=Salix dunnii TaxID=1413687 RepID=A0A835JQA0_9ROSI|nr:hypothetical protein SADUNF_Sadunf09G0035100 [Salix dunnii]
MVSLMLFACCANPLIGAGSAKVSFEPNICSRIAWNEWPGSESMKTASSETKISSALESDTEIRFDSDPVKPSISGRVDLSQPRTYRSPGTERKLLNTERIERRAGVDDKSFPATEKCEKIAVIFPGKERAVKKEVFTGFRNSNFDDDDYASPTLYFLLATSERLICKRWLLLVKIKLLAGLRKAMEMEELQFTELSPQVIAL